MNSAHDSMAHPQLMLSTMPVEVRKFIFQRVYNNKTRIYVSRSATSLRINATTFKKLPPLTYTCRAVHAEAKPTMWHSVMILAEDRAALGLLKQYQKVPKDFLAHITELRLEDQRGQIRASDFAIFSGLKRLRLCVFDRCYMAGSLPMEVDSDEISEEDREGDLSVFEHFLPQGKVKYLESLDEETAAIIGNTKRGVRIRLTMCYYWEGNTYTANINGETPSEIEDANGETEDEEGYDRVHDHRHTFKEYENVRVVVSEPQAWCCAELIHNSVLSSTGTRRTSLPG